MALTGGQYVFVSAIMDDSLRVFRLDDESLASVTTIPVCHAPSEVRGRKDGKYVWTVCRAADAAFTGSVALIDTSTLQVAHTIAVGNKPTHSYAAPDGKTGFVMNDGSDSMSVINTDTGDVMNVPIGKGHHKLAIATDGQGGPARFYYASNIVDSTITVLDAQYNQVGTITVGLSPHGMDYSFRSKRVYNCSGDAAHDVEVISTDGADAQTIVARVPLDGARCSHLEVTPDGKYAIGSQSGNNTIARIDVDTNAVDYFPAGTGPGWFADAQNQLWVENDGAWTVFQINMTTWQGAPLVAGTEDPNAAPPGGESRGLAVWDPWVFIANSTISTVSVVRADHGHVHATLENIPGARNAAVGGAMGGNPYPR
jgi:YVTN family beta-propeller protein